MQYEVNDRLVHLSGVIRQFQFALIDFKAIIPCFFEFDSVWILNLQEMTISLFFTERLFLVIRDSV